MSPLELAILRTVIYASLFDYPLRVDELHWSLIGCAARPRDILATFARSTALRRVLEYHDGFLIPAERRDLIRERRAREGRSLAFLREHDWMLGLICAIPFTRLVALSGSVAHLNLEPSGDLDLFIVTRGPRVWAVTVAVLLLTKLMRRRRIICANFIVADTHLALEQQDLFTANQVIHLKPLVGRSVLEQLHAANPFVARIYPNARPERCSAWVTWSPGTMDGFKRALEWALAAPSPAIERLCRAAYGWYLRRRSTNWQSPEQVQLQADYLKLHTHSHRQAVLARYDAAVAAALATAGDARRTAVRAVAR